MAEIKTPEDAILHEGGSRRDFLKAVAFITLAGGTGALARSVPAETVPPEPGSLDEPTPLQEGDPEPEEMTVPAQEPEQTSQEAPPSQLIDDVRPEPPGPGYVWVTGYWWWTNGRYVWVPGYWALPPDTEYVYAPGYWTYRGTSWVYVRGGWARPGTRVVVAYPDPRPVRTAFVVTAPIRIARRHRRWNHYHDRRSRHVVVHTSPPRKPPAARPAAPAGKPTPRPAAPARRPPPRRR